MGIVVGIKGSRIERRAEVHRIHPTLLERITIHIGEEGAGPNRVYTDGSKQAGCTGAAWVAFYGEVETQPRVHSASSGTGGDS